MPAMNDPELEEFLARFTPDIRELALQTRALILECYPDVLEMVDPPSGIVAYGYSRKYADLVCAIAPFRAHVNLMFSRGADLPDPAGLLTGTGKRARHARIEHPEDLQRPELRALILAAVNKR